MRNRIVDSSFIHACHSSGRDLEKAVEDLSELLESPIEPETIPDLRANMTNKTVSTPPNAGLISQICLLIHLAGICAEEK